MKFFFWQLAHLFLRGSAPVLLRPTPPLAPCLTGFLLLGSMQVKYMLVTYWSLQRPGLRGYTERQRQRERFIWRKWLIPLQRGQTPNLQSRPAEVPARVPRPPGGRTPSSLGNRRSFLAPKVFNWLDKAHPLYGAQSGSLKVYWCQWGLLGQGLFLWPHPWHADSPARDQTCATAVTMPDPQPSEPPGNSYHHFFFIEVELTHNAVLVSGVQPRDPVIHISTHTHTHTHTLIIFQILSPYKLLQNTKYTSVL